ncbi:MAG: ABC transporter ATP-binding protein, partial [Anaerolineales bacterium]
FEVIHNLTQSGMTVVMVEHKVEWIAHFANRVIALKDGAIFMEGKPSDVLTSDMLIENGFGVSRYTSVAREAKKQGLWKKEKLPVTLFEAAEGFGNNGGRVD